MDRFQVINYNNDPLQGPDSVSVSSLVSDTGIFTKNNSFSFDVQRLVSGTVTGPIVTTSPLVNNGAPGPFQQTINISTIGPLNIDDQFRVTYYDVFFGSGAGAPTVTDDLTVTSSSCFVRGTLIRTPTGDMPVEDLKVGDSIFSVGTLKDRRDLIPYSDKLAKPIVRVIKYRTQGKLDKITRPVKITAGAFGDNLPTQDLFVSPWHAFVKDGRLKSAEHMLNGSTIDYDNSCESAEYYHLELEEHSAIIANGVETESFYDDTKPPVA